MNPIKKLNISVVVIILVILLPTSSMGQGMPVYDNTNFISLAKQLVESAKQTSQLLKTVEFLKEQKDHIEQVSTTVRQLNAVKKLVKNNQQLLNMVNRDVKSIINSPYITYEEIPQVITSFEDILVYAMESISYVDKILTSHFLKMTDAERATLLKVHESQSDELLVEVSLKTKRYKEVISFRKMQEKINSRITQF